MTSGVPFGSGPEEAAADAEPTSEQPAVKAPSSPPPAASPPPLAIPGIPLDRPELHVGAAFVGGFVLATVLKRLAR